MNINQSYFRARDICPACTSTDRTIFYSAPMAEGVVRDFIDSHFAPQGHIDWALLDGTDYALAECSDCSLVYQVAEPRDALMEVIYTRMIDPAFLTGYEQTRLSLDGFHDVAGELTTLFALCGKPPSQISLLDFGFGHARWARVARAMGATVYGTEIGEEKRRLAESLGIVYLDGAAIDGMRFDIVHSEQVFEHVGNPRDLFARLAKVTGQYLKIAVPPGAGTADTIRRHGLANQSPFGRALKGLPPTRHDSAYTAIQPLEHLNAFVPRTMERLGQDFGMTLISRARRRVVSVDVDGVKPLLKSTGNIGRAVARAVLPANMAGDTGYYLFRPK